MTENPRRRRRLFSAGLLSALLAAALAAACGIGIYLGQGKPPDTHANGVDASAVTVAPQPSAPALRAVSQPAPVEIAVATVDAQAPDFAAPDTPLALQVGPADATPRAAAAQSHADDNQADAEMIDLRHEQSHAVAPVPMQNESLAAAVVPLATVQKIRRPSPLALVPPATGVPMRHVLVTDVKDQPQIANGMQTLSLASASLADPQGRFDSKLTRGWPVYDETPIVDPAALAGVISPGDSLYFVVQDWLAPSRKGKRHPALVETDELDHAIERSTQPWQVLYEMGRIAALLDGLPQQKCFWQAAIQRAAITAAGRSEPSVASQRDIQSMNVLAGTALWLWQDDALAAQALGLLVQWQNSEAAQLSRSRTLYATALGRALFHERQYGQSLAVLSTVLWAAARPVF